VFSVVTAADLGAVQQALRTTAGARYESVELALRCHLTKQRTAIKTLAGSTSAIASPLRELREQYDISYVVVSEADADAMASVAAEPTGT
jgi:hypothetical protein